MRLLWVTPDAVFVSVDEEWEPPPPPMEGVKGERPHAPMIVTKVQSKREGSQRRAIMTTPLSHAPGRNDTEGSSARRQFERPFRIAASHPRCPQPRLDNATGAETRACSAVLAARRNGTKIQARWLESRKLLRPRLPPPAPLLERTAPAHAASHGIEQPGIDRP